MVPKNFEFPKRVDLKTGLHFWFYGLTCSTSGALTVQPFRKLKPSGLHTKGLINKYRLQWRMLFEYLEKGVHVQLPEDTKQITSAEFKAYYTRCVVYLNQTVSYCFKVPNPMKQSISTWLVLISRSTILKRGTNSDKSFLPEVSTQ